jgi:hypothetical protein
VLVLASCALQGVLPEGAVPPCVVIDGKSSSFSFALDALEVVRQLACDDWLPSTRDTKVRRGAGHACAAQQGNAAVAATSGSSTANNMAENGSSVCTAGGCLQLMPVCSVCR